MADTTVLQEFRRWKCKDERAALMGMNAKDLPERVTRGLVTLPADLLKGRKRHKFSAVTTVVDGILFASRAEARRYGQLKVLERAGAIKNLKLQPAFNLSVNGIHICRYVGDFVYERPRGGDWNKAKEWERVVEDVKGVRTAVFKIKRQLMIACHSIEILEVHR